jgi:hypothetical protein
MRKVLDIVDIKGLTNNTVNSLPKIQEHYG